MEVLVTRQASRTLIGLLSITTVVGVGAYAVAHRKPGTSSTNKQVAVQPAGGATLLSAMTPPTTAPSSLAIVPLKPGVVDDQKADVRLASDTKLVSTVQPATPISAKGVLAEGEAKIKAGDELAGRKILNEALVNGQLSETDAIAAKKLMAEANKAIIFSTKRYPDDPWQGTHVVGKGELLQKIAFAESLTSDFLLRINGISDAHRLRAGTTIKTIQGPFHVVVTKHLFTMDLYLGSPGEKNAQYVTSYGVGLGTQNSTPTGTWMVEQRIPNPKYYSPRGEGTVEAGDPKNPLGKYWIALTGTDGNAVGKQSYGIHGTIDPDSIGKMSSMGCIRMHNEDVALVFEDVVAGKTTVVVKD